MKDRLIADNSRMNLMMAGADTEMRDATGLSFIQSAAVEAIAAGADQPHKLSRAVGLLHSQSITGILDRLEMRGVIHRRVGGVEMDRRGVRLELTEKGLALVPKIRANLDRVAAEQYDAAGMKSEAMFL